MGESPFNPHLTYLDLDGMRDYLCDTFGDGEESPACNIGVPFSISPDEVVGVTNSTEYKGVEYITYDWSLDVRNGGKFELTSVYDISE